MGEISLIWWLTDTGEIPPLNTMTWLAVLGGLKLGDNCIVFSALPISITGFTVTILIYLATQQSWVKPIFATVKAWLTSAKLKI